MFEQFSVVLKYAFVLIIYLFVFSIIRTVYTDISGMSNSQNDSSIYSYERKMSERDRKNKAYLKIVSEYCLKDKPTDLIIKLNKSTFVIGRTNRCDIYAEDLYMSKKHTKIWLKDNEWHINDLGSKNGTFVNDEQINDICLLDDKDKIKIGQLELIYCETIY